MNDSSPYHVENWIGAIIFPVLFGIFTFSATLIPVIGTVVAMVVVLITGFFIAWCNAPFLCRCIIGIVSAIGYILSLLVSHVPPGTAVGNIISFGVFLMLGLIVGFLVNLVRK